MHTVFWKVVAPKRYRARTKTVRKLKNTARSKNKALGKNKIEINFFAVSSQYELPGVENQ